MFNILYYKYIIFQIHCLVIELLLLDNQDVIIVYHYIVPNNGMINTPISIDQKERHLHKDVNVIK